MDKDNNTAPPKAIMECSEKNKIIAGLIILFMWFGIFWFTFFTVTGAKTAGEIFESQYLLKRAQNMERQNYETAKIKEELARKPELERAIENFEAFLADRDDPDKARAIDRASAAIRAARTAYTETSNRLGKTYSGSFYSVDQALFKINTAISTIQQDVTTTKRRRETLSPAERRAERREERTLLLYEQLIKAGDCLEYSIDSVGFKNDFNSLVINGSRSMYPGAFSLSDCWRLFSEIDLVQERNEEHDMMIFLLQSDDLSGEKFYGKKADFNMETLWKLNAENAYTTSFSFAYDTASYSVSNTRIAMWIIDGCETFIVDLRPHGRQKWSLWYTIDRDRARNIYTENRSFRQTGSYKGYPPKDYYYSTRLFKYNGYNYFRHREIDKYLFGKWDDSPGVTVIRPENLFIEDADDAITVGKAFEETGNYYAALNAYQVATENKSEYGSYNVARLLAEEKISELGYMMTNRYDMAVGILTPLLQSSDKIIVGRAANMLGIIYSDTRNKKSVPGNNVEYYKISAENGNPYGAYNYAWYLAHRDEQYDLAEEYLTSPLNSSDENLQQNAIELRNWIYEQSGKGTAIAIQSVFEQYFRGQTQENIDMVIAVVGSRQQDATRKSTLASFAEEDAEYKIISQEIVSVNGNIAKVQVVRERKVLKGSSVSNRATILYTLEKQSNEWKIIAATVEAKENI